MEFFVLNGIQQIYFKINLQKRNMNFLIRTNVSIHEIKFL